MILMLMALMVLGCENNTNPCALRPEVLKHIHNLDSLIGITEVRERHREWMKSNYDEPSIFDATSETYRFIFSTTGYDKVVRIEESNGHYSGIVKEFNWISGGTSLAPRVEQFELPQQTWDSLMGRLESLSFWIHPNPPDHKVLDGASWSLDAFKPVRNECTSMQFQHLGTSYSVNDTAFMAMCKLFDDLDKDTDVEVGMHPAAEAIATVNTNCDFVYDTITNPNYQIHLAILAKWHHPEKRGYVRDRNGDTLNHFLYTQDIIAFANGLDSTEQGLYRALTNKVVFLILEHEPRMLDYGLTLGPRAPEDVDYVMYHVAHPMCNTMSMDSLISTIRSEMGEPHEAAKQVKQMLLENLERAEAR